MAQLTVVSWRDIPAQVIVKAGRQTAKRELSKRFIESIDRVAMRQGLAGTDDYLEQWRRSDPVSCGDDLEAEADRAVIEIESRHGPEALKAFVESGGWRA